MKIIHCQQGTTEWMQARAGLCTASRFADAISTTGGLSEQQKLFVDLVRGAGLPQKEAAERAGYKAVPRAESIAKALDGVDPSQPSDVALRYAADLAIERVSGNPFGIPAKSWVLDRGHEMEYLARQVYEERFGCLVTESGLCVDGDDRFAYSSDGFVDSDGLTEFKAPVDSAKILNIWRTGDISEYIHQCFGGLWITNRKWIDLCVYVPDLACVGKDLFVKRIYRDEAFIDDMVLKLARFNALVDANVAALMAKTEQPIAA